MQGCTSMHISKHERVDDRKAASMHTYAATNTITNAYCCYACLTDACICIHG